MTDRTATRALLVAALIASAFLFKVWLGLGIDETGYHMWLSSVVFDGDLNLDLSPYIPEAVLDVWGLLVADGVGTWVLKPRGANDVQP